MRPDYISYWHLKREMDHHVSDIHPIQHHPTPPSPSRQPPTHQNCVCISALFLSFPIKLLGHQLAQWWQISGRYMYKTGTWTVKLTLLPPDKMAIFSQTIHSGHFRERKVLYLDWNDTEYYSWWSNWQWPNIASDNGLAPKRRQAIIWNNADPIHRSMYMSLGWDVVRG